MKTGPRAGPPRRRREHPTSSRKAAISWLQRSRRPREVMRLFLEVLRYADRVVEEELRWRDTARRTTRRANRIRHAAARLAEEAPDLITLDLKDDGDPETWKAPYLQERVDTALAPFHKGQGASATFRRRTTTLSVAPSFGRSSDRLNRGTLAAGLLLTAAEIVGVARPSGLETAVMAIVVGMEGEDPARQDNQQDEAERRWNARFRLAAARLRASQPNPQDVATTFEDEL